MVASDGTSLALDGRRAGQIGIAGLAQKILARRLAKVEAGKDEFLTVAQLKKTSP